MKALAIVLALFLVAMPITAGPVDLPVPNLLDQLYSWFTAVWEAVEPMIDPSGNEGTPPQEEMGPLIVPSGSSAEIDGPPQEEMGPLIDPSGQPQEEMGPMIDPFGND